MPVLIQNNQKTIIETRLKKFYSMTGQAFLLYKQNNNIMGRDVNTPALCNNSGENSFDCNLKVFNTYFAPYLKYVKTENKDDNLYVYFADGSAVKFTYYGHDILFFPKASKADADKVIVGKDAFLFGFYPGWCENHVRANEFCDKAVEPYVGINYDGTDESLYADCVNAAKILQLNNWSIPDGYPCFTEKPEDPDDII